MSLNLNELCRACLGTGRVMCSLVESIVPKFDSPPQSVVDFWDIFTKMLISYEDKFPNEICSECRDEIQRTYSFILRCKRSEDILTKIKNVKIYLKNLKIGSVSHELFVLENVKSENYLRPNISQIETGDFELNDSIDVYDKDIGETGHFEGNIDSQVDQRSQQTLTAQHEDKRLGSELSHHPDSENDIANGKLSATQDVKQEPELDISVENDEFEEIESEGRSSIEMFKCSACDYENSMEILEEHIIENHVDGQMCKLCGKEFQFTAIEHWSTHHYLNSTEEVPESTYKKQYKCKLCSKIFRSTYTLNRHLIIHTGERPFKCEFCPKTFRRKGNLTTHLRCHTGERPFECEICSKRFQHKFDLTRHLRCHTGERPFKCEFCLKSFRVKNNLTTHLRCHTKEKPFKCEICVKSFRSRRHLADHLRCHTGERPFKCEVCAKTFRQKSYLTIHLRCHTGERPFKCEICTQSFGQKSHLTRHLRCHTDERPFKCKICQNLKSFRDKRGLRFHLKKHTAKDERSKVRNNANFDSQLDQGSQDATIVQNQNDSLEDRRLSRLYYDYKSDATSERVRTTQDIKLEPEVDIFSGQQVI